MEKKQCIMNHARVIDINLKCSKHSSSKEVSLMDESFIFLNPVSATLKFQYLKTEMYIDKSGMLSLLNNRICRDHRYVCISRPRRFGKSYAAAMIASYYQSAIETRDIFSDLSIAKDPSFEAHLNKYNVIFINIKKHYNGNSEDMVKSLKTDLANEIKDKFSYLKIPKLSGDITNLFNWVFLKTNVPFIFVIDEWDCVMRESKERKNHEDYLDFLTLLLKDEAYVGLAYMTGILPIKRCTSESSLNMFSGYSMMQPRQFAEFVGFTENEVKLACERRGMDFESMKAWYEGYKFGDLHIYSPMSVSNALYEREINNYWTQSASYESLRSYICMNYDGLKETVVQLLENPLSSKKIKTTLFSNDVHNFSSADDVLTLLVHLGYLGYDSKTNEIYIPNMEVREVFRASISDPIWSGLIKIHAISKELLDDTLNMDGAKVAKAIELVHQRIITIENYNSEEALSYVISWAYVHANAYYNKFAELESGKGFIDALYLPKPEYSSKPPLLIELKWNRSIKTAINQIIDKDYIDKAKELGYNKVLLVGINYSERTKKHTCKILEIAI
jgi:hypothetical protein